MNCFYFPAVSTTKKGYECKKNTAKDSRNSRRYECRKEKQSTVTYSKFTFIITWMLYTFKFKFVIEQSYVTSNTKIKFIKIILSIYFVKLHIMIYLFLF